MRSELVTIFGGSGFLGRYVTREFAKRGWRVRAAVRRPHLAPELRVAGIPGQVQIAAANIRKPETVRQAIEGADAVVNLVGILKSIGKQTFAATQADGAATVAEAARDAGVTAFVHMSAIGADRESKSAYARTKAMGEDAVRERIPEAMILRPSIVFGPEDEFFNRFAAMASISPVLPVFAPKVRFQPVYVRDVAEAVANAVERPDARGRTFELGGPRAYTFKALMRMILDVTRRPRVLLPQPQLSALAMGAALGWAPGAPITLDQARLLGKDNVVSDGADTLADLGVTPTSVETILPTYLYRFRKAGQFTPADAESEADSV